MIPDSTDSDPDPPHGVGRHQGKEERGEEEEERVGDFRRRRDLAIRITNQIPKTVNTRTAHPAYTSTTVPITSVFESSSEDEACGVGGGGGGLSMSGVWGVGRGWEGGVKVGGLCEKFVS